MATTVDKALLRAIRPDIDAALVAVAKKYGLQKLSLANATFDPRAGAFTFKLEGLADGAIGKEAALYTSPDARFLGLPPLGTAFTSGGRGYKTAGLNKAGTKVLCDRVDDGKTYLFAVDVVLRMCHPAVAA